MAMYLYKLIGFILIPFIPFIIFRRLSDGKETKGRTTERYGKTQIKNISNKLGLSQKDSLLFIQHFFSFLTNNHSKRINIHNFGTFINKVTPERIGRNPKTKEEFVINPRFKLSFKPSGNIKNLIN